MSIKFGIIKELKNPPDRRVVFSPTLLKKAKQQFPEAHFVVESSAVRVFQDQEYRDAGFDVVTDLSDCDVLIGVKEVPVTALISDKQYFFFSHTIKKQPYNKALLQTILKKNITLYDHETLVDEKGFRLLGFGYYAGIVGAYNGCRALGLKDAIFELPKASTLMDKKALLAALKKIQLPAIKIVLTGTGRVGTGAKEILDHLKIKEVSVEQYLHERFDEAVYVQLGALDYNRRKDGGVSDLQDFFAHPEEYCSDFERFSEVSAFFIAGHFYGQGAPPLLTKMNVKSPRCALRVVADISCDIEGPIATTIRASTIANPIYGYERETGAEVAFKAPDAIAVMAVDNLPCELPRDASEGFGQAFMDKVLPAFFNGDATGVLERARMTQDQELASRFSYLQDYIS